MIPSDRKPTAPDPKVQERGDDAGVLELAARRRGDALHPLDLGPSAASAASSGLPPAWRDGVASFYEILHDPASLRACSGTACAFAAHAETGSDARGVHCLGRCYEAPADTSRAASRIPRRSMTTTPVVLRHLLAATAPVDWSDYELPEGDEILAAVTACGLRGRGGAAYPTGLKWKRARETAAPDRYVIANGDEGDPGAYIDRLLLEDAPHSVLAGMAACGRAVGATRGIVYVRGEYPRAAECMEKAIAEAEAAGVLAPMTVRVVRGAGSYVAGEETALLRSIEGLRAEPAAKPPYPAERGLRGLPTVVQNVETLSVIPWVVRTRSRADTKAVCLAGAIASPGVVEIDLGTPLRRVLEEGGGGAPAGSRWKMALVGGPFGRVVAERDFDIALSFETLPGMGHAGIVVFDESVSVRALAAHIFDFARSESCGNCTPCRVGSSRLASCATRSELLRLLDTMEAGSLCGFGQGVPRPVRDLLAAFGDEVMR
jgi:NADH:ubiquinone oxidoreductase subunit F (NADH-binding)